MTEPDSEHSIERLIKLAGERDMPTSEGMERARLAAQESWCRMLAQQVPAPRRSWRKPVLGFAIAAGIAALAVFTWTQRPMPAPPELVARIATLTGDALFDGKSVARVAQLIACGHHACDE